MHLLIEQLRFARSELQRALEGVTDEEARRRLEPMNCIAWNVGHLAWQEQRYWLTSGQGQVVRPELNEQFRYGGPPCEPPLAEAWDAWRAITAAADPWLDGLKTADLQEPHQHPSGRTFTFGTLLLRTTYHYWYHIGESLAVRQLLGHRNLPDFVGNIDDDAPYRP